MPAVLLDSADGSLKQKKRYRTLKRGRRSLKTPDTRELFRSDSKVVICGCSRRCGVFSSVFGRDMYWQVPVYPPPPHLKMLGIVLILRLWTMDNGHVQIVHSFSTGI